MFIEPSLYASQSPRDQEGGKGPVLMEFIFRKGWIDNEIKLGMVARVC